MRRIVAAMVLTLTAAPFIPAAFGVSVPAMVVDVFGTPVSEAVITIYKAVDDPTEKYGVRLVTVSAGVSDTYGELFLELPDTHVSLKVRASHEDYVTHLESLPGYGLDTGIDAGVTVHADQGMPTGLTIRMERSFFANDLLGLETSKDEEILPQIRQFLSCSLIMLPAWDAVFHIDDRLRPHLLSLRIDPIVGSRALDVLAHWYPEQFTSKKRPRLEYPWPVVADVDLDQAIGLAMSSKLRPGEEDKLEVRRKSFDSTRTRVIVRCAIQHEPRNKGVYVLFFRKIEMLWQIGYAGKTATEM